MLIPLIIERVKCIGRWSTGLDTHRPRCMAWAVSTCGLFHRENDEVFTWTWRDSSKSKLFSRGYRARALRMSAAAASDIDDESVTNAHTRRRKRTTRKRAIGIEERLNGFVLATAEDRAHVCYASYHFDRVLLLVLRHLPQRTTKIERSLSWRHYGKEL